MILILFCPGSVANLYQFAWVFAFIPKIRVRNPILILPSIDWVFNNWFTFHASKILPNISILFICKCQGGGLYIYFSALTMTLCDVSSNVAVAYFIHDYFCMFNCILSLSDSIKKLQFISALALLSLPPLSPQYISISCVLAALMFLKSCVRGCFVELLSSLECMDESFTLILFQRIQI